MRQCIVVFFSLLALSSLAMGASPQSGVNSSSPPSSAAPPVLWRYVDENNKIVYSLATPPANARDVMQVKPPTQDEISRKYMAELMRAIERKWIRPATIDASKTCAVEVIQVPGGEVVSVNALQDCAYDTIEMESVFRAVLKANPLPYAGFESVFRRKLVLRFRAASQVAAEP